MQIGKMKSKILLNYIDNHWIFPRRNWNKPRCIKYYPCYNKNINLRHFFKNPMMMKMTNNLVIFNPHRNMMMKNLEIFNQLIPSWWNKKKKKTVEVTWKPTECHTLSTTYNRKKKNFPRNHKNKNENGKTETISNENYLLFPNFCLGTTISTE